MDRGYVLVLQKHFVYFDYILPYLYFDSPFSIHTKTHLHLSEELL